MQAILSALNQTTVATSARLSHFRYSSGEITSKNVTDAAKVKNANRALIFNALQYVCFLLGIALKTEYNARKVSSQQKRKQGVDSQIAKDGRSNLLSEFE